MSDQGLNAGEIVVVVRDLIGVRVGLQIEVNGQRYGQCTAVCERFHDATAQEFEALPEIIVTQREMRTMARMMNEVADNYDRAARGEVKA